jgi:predicted flap endonuclease-1-like 5' DNA nuclease
MGYVFGKAFWWILLALAVGGFVGWNLNGWRRRSFTETTGASTASADEVERLRSRVANLEPVVADRDEARQRIADLEAELRDCRSTSAAMPAQGFADLPADAPSATVADRFAGVTLDVAQASSVLGEKVAVDDLKVVEGIGPKIAELLHGGGVTTWALLADTPVSRLQEILSAAGERFRIHDPSTWPRQAELLAFGRWDDFKRLTDQLSAGRE